MLHKYTSDEIPRSVVITACGGYQRRTMFGDSTVVQKKRTYYYMEIESCCDKKKNI